MWIEQLIQKKKDLELDYLIATTTKEFTRPSIIKARHYGVILEKAELITPNMVKDLDDEFFYDIFYIIPKLTRLDFLLNNGKIVSLKELLKKIGFIEQQELLNSLNYDLFLNFDFNKILEKTNIKSEDFFKYDNNYLAEVSLNSFVNENAVPIIKKLGIINAAFDLKITPYRLSLPINNSLSTFTPKDKKNKRFKVVFGDEEENVTIGYTDNKKIIALANLKPREYHRIVGGNTYINTIFPKDAEIEFTINNMNEVVLSKFDYSELT